MRIAPLVAEARSLGVEARAWAADLAGEVELPRDCPPVGGLLCAAGATADAPLARLSPADWERAQKVNLRGHARLLGALGRPGLLAPGARGLLVGSLAGLRGRAGQAAYAAAKGGLLDLLPLAPPGLRLNVLLPPLLPSPLLEALTPAERGRLFSERLLEDPDPAESCARAAAFLLSDAASYVHRQALNPDSRVTALGWE